MRTIKITVAGQSFHLKSDASQSHVQELAQTVENKFRELKKGASRGDQDFMIMSMVAVSLLDELNQAKERCERVSELAEAFAKRLIERIDALLAQDL
jgi:cell division protein ZapA (FtsZ GTPase activity inhibitor)